MWVLYSNSRESVVVFNYVLDIFEDTNFFSDQIPENGFDGFSYKQITELFFI